MPKLGLSEQNIIYYANLAEFYTIQKLRRLTDKNLVRLYLLCYVHRQFLKINDHLVSSLIQKMTKYADDANDYQRSKIELIRSLGSRHARCWTLISIAVFPMNKSGPKPLKLFQKPIIKNF